MADIYLADVSEYQTNVDAPTYLQYHKSIICRVHNGYREDKLAPVRVPYLRSHPFTGIGWYQYVVPDRDPQVQAQELISAVGQLRDNEFVIGDFEVVLSSNDKALQTQRAQTWFGIVDAWANMAATLYSDLDFLQNHIDLAAIVPRPVWVADYSSVEPSIAHVLWQCTDQAFFGAITPSYPVDGNVFHGLDDDFIYMMRHGRTTN